MKRLIEQLDWTQLRRAGDFLSKPVEPWPSALKPMAAVAIDGSFAVVYVPRGLAEITLDSSHLPAKLPELIAYDAATGQRIAVRFRAEERPVVSVATGKDWVLLVRGIGRRHSP